MAGLRPGQFIHGMCGMMEWLASGLVNLYFMENGMAGLRPGQFIHIGKIVWLASGLINLAIVGEWERKIGMVGLRPDQFSHLAILDMYWQGIPDGPVPCSINLW